MCGVDSYFFLSFTDIPPGERLLKIIQQLSVETRNNRLIEESAKMAVVVGNLSEDSLGLNSEDYDTLLESVDTIIHNGAVVNSALPYSGIVLHFNFSKNIY